MGRGAALEKERHFMRYRSGAAPVIAETATPQTRSGSTSVVGCPWLVRGLPEHGQFDGDPRFQPGLGLVALLLFKFDGAEPLLGLSGPLGSELGHLLGGQSEVSGHVVVRPSAVGQQKRLGA
jgi:hypothetical protein